MFADGALRTALDFLDAHPDVAMVYGNADYIDCKGKLIAPCAHIEPFNFHRLLHYSDYIVQPAAFSGDLLKHPADSSASLNWTMDYDLWLKIARQIKVAYLPKHCAATAG